MATPEDHLIVELTPGSERTLLDLRYALRVLGWARGAYSWNPKMERAYRRLRRAICSLAATTVTDDYPGACSTPPLGYVWCTICNGAGAVPGAKGQYRESLCSRCDGMGILDAETGEGGRE